MLSAENQGQSCPVALPGNGQVKVCLWKLCVLTLLLHWQWFLGTFPLLYQQKIGEAEPQFHSLSQRAGQGTAWGSPACAKATPEMYSQHRAPAHPSTPGCASGQGRWTKAGRTLEHNGSTLPCPEHQWPCPEHQWPQELPWGLVGSAWDT